MGLQIINEIECNNDSNKMKETTLHAPETTEQKHQKIMLLSTDNVVITEWK